MKNILYSMIVLVLFALLGGCFLMQPSHYQVKPLALGATLPACPERPNCVRSETDTPIAQKISALCLEYGLQAEQLASVARAIEDTGGTIMLQTSSYLHAEYRSRLFGFVDDLMVRFDPDKSCLQIRSASRIGYSDMGVNRERVEAIRTILNSDLN